MASILLKKTFRCSEGKNGAKKRVFLRICNPLATDLGQTGTPRVKFDQQLHSVFSYYEMTKLKRAIKLELAAAKVSLLIKLINKLRAKLFLIGARATKEQNKIRIFAPNQMKPTILYVDY